MNLSEAFKNRMLSLAGLINEAGAPMPPAKAQQQQPAQQQQQPAQQQQQQQPAQQQQQQGNIVAGKQYQLQLIGIASDPIIVSGKFNDWTAAQGGGTFIVDKSNQQASDWGQGCQIHLPLTFAQKPVNPLNVTFSHGQQKQYNNVTVKVG